MAGLKLPRVGKRATATSDPSDNHRKSREDPLGYVLAVLRGVLELEPGRVDGPSPDTQGVEQTVLGVPGGLGGFAGVPDSIRIDRHSQDCRRGAGGAAFP